MDDVRVVIVETKGLLFDMDGVLVSSIESVRRCWRTWAEHYGVEKFDSLEIPHGTRAVDVMQMLKPGVDLKEGLRFIEDLEVADVADTRVLAGARELLESLPAHRWTVVTSATRPLVMSRLGAAGLKVPESLVTAEMVERGKPDPEPYRRGAEVLELRPEDCIVVEDAVTGVKAGVAAGCRVLCVEGTYPAEALHAAGATWVVPTLREVSVVMKNEGIGLRLHRVSPGKAAV